MNFDINEYKNFYEKAKNHSFLEIEGIFINDFKFSREVITGIDKNNFLVILLPLDKEIAGFQIKDFITLKENTKFFAENKKVILSGTPLVYKRKNYIDHFGFLSQINLILNSSEFLTNLSQFLDILQKAHNSKNYFRGPAFFAEACTILRLSNFYPKIKFIFQSQVFLEPLNLFPLLFSLKLTESLVNQLLIILLRKY